MTFLWCQIQAERCPTCPNICWKSALGKNLIGSPSIQVGLRGKDKVAMPGQSRIPNNSGRFLDTRSPARPHLGGEWLWFNQDGMHVRETCHTYVDLIGRFVSLGIWGKGLRIMRAWPLEISFLKLELV